ncbi:hypothetical protein [Rathayibacter toxicus]|uniref:hypothetical protein n=1 Tax=Rathayibacter toxicus TaxID=145458 RepID=UPI001C05E156|nr:hypothetical protein [Rathayibacter toxicus]QWL48305.1 hypothetical protein E2R43_00780 [Rathayibacter toxicus]
MRAFSEPKLESGIALVGIPAAEWMREKGCEVVAAQEGLRLFSDVLFLDGLSLGRFYHNAREVVRHAGSDEGGAVLIVLDGEVDVVDEAATVRVGKGHGLVLRGGRPIRLLSGNPYGLVELRLSPHRGVVIRDGISLVPIVAESASLRLLLAVSSVILNVAGSVPEDGWASTGDVLRAAVAGVFDDVARSDNFRRPSNLLVDRARRVIAARSSDQEFNVASLTALLAVSPALLHRSFAVLGTTPLTELRRYRLETAKRLLRGGGAPRRLGHKRRRSGWPASDRCARFAVHPEGSTMSAGAPSGS